MPVGRPFNLQWRNHNATRAYPLADAASKRDISGTIRIPDSLLVGMQLGIHVGLNVSPAKFFLRKLIVSPVGFTLVLAYDDEADFPYVASVHVPVSTHVENAVYALGFRDDFIDCVGEVMIGPLVEALELPAGDYTFSPAGGLLEPDAIRPYIRGISSLTVVNGGSRSERLYGDITLTAGTNFRITATTSPSPVITFSAIAGEGLNEECECDNADQAPCIRTINGIPPTSQGDFTFVGNDCIVIEPSDGPHSLTFRDDCSKPCCGCRELDALESQLQRFGDGRATLEGHVYRVAAEVSQMNLVVLGSRLGDVGCET